MKKTLILFSFFFLNTIVYASHFDTQQTSTTTLATTFVKKAGDTMTGALTTPSLTTTYGIAASTCVITNMTATYNVNAGSVTTTRVSAKDSNGLYFYDDSTNYIFLKDGGNVGLGTTTVNDKFHILGDIRQTSTFPGITWYPSGWGGLFGGMQAGVDSGFGGAGNFIGFYTPATKSFTIKGGTSGRLTVEDGGNIGIGTTAAATARLHVVGGSILGQYDIRTTSASFSSNVFINTVIYPRTATQTLYSTNTISVNATNLVIVSSGGVVALTSNPQIQTATVTTDTVIMVTGSSDTNVVTLSTGNGLKLAGGASFSLGLDDVICLKYNGTLWTELFRSNN